jgi:hypothetical protein
MKRFFTLLTIVFVMLMVVALFAQKADNTTFKYVGAKKCKMCHNKSKTGKQFSLWEKRGHAKAYETLASTESKEIAAEMGIKGSPQEAKECLVCHVTAYDAPADQKEITLTMEEGVSCEACHGPGSAYKNMKIMKDLHSGAAKAIDHGLIEPTAEVCVKCHNKKSPTYKEFVYEKAVKLIEHPVANLNTK